MARERLGVQSRSEYARAVKRPDGEEDQQRNIISNEQMQRSEGVGDDEGRRCAGRSEEDCTGPPPPPTPPPPPPPRPPPPPAGSPLTLRAQALHGSAHWSTGAATS